MRKVILAAAVTAACAGFSPMPASAHEGHTSCKAAGEFVSTLAQTLSPLGQTFVRPAAQAGDRGISDVVASAHAVLCEQTG